MLICEWCDEEFQRPSPKGRAPKYCRGSHRQRAYERRRLEQIISAAIRESQNKPGEAS